MLELTSISLQEIQKKIKKRREKKKSKSINPLAVFTLSNARKAGEYSDKEEAHH